MYSFQKLVWATMKIWRRGILHSPKCLKNKHITSVTLSPTVSHTHTHTHTHIHTYTQTQTHTHCMHAFMYACIHTIISKWVERTVHGTNRVLRSVLRRCSNVYNVQTLHLVCFQHAYPLMRCSSIYSWTKKYARTGVFVAGVHAAQQMMCASTYLCVCISGAWLCLHVHSCVKLFVYAQTIHLHMYTHS